MGARCERLRDFHANLHPLLRAVLWLGVLAVLAALAGRPAYRVFKSWRAERNLENARAALAAGQAAQARENAYAAIRLAPQKFDAIPVLAESMRRMNDPRAADIARILLGHPQTTDVDRLEGFRILAEQAPLATVGVAWNFLGKERQAEPAYREAFVRRLVEQTHFSEAWMLLQEAGPQGRSAELDTQWISLTMLSGEGQLWYQAQELGRKVLKEHPQFGADVLKAWERLPIDGVQHDTAAAASAWVEAGGAGVPVAARLAAGWLAGAVMAKDQREAHWQQMITKYLAVDPGALADWLNRHGMADRVAALAVTPAQAAEEPWFRAKAEALRLTKQGDKLLEHLANPPRTISPMDLACLRMQAAVLSGNTARRNLEWKQASDLARADSTRNAWLALAEQAAVVGMREQAEDAMVEALKLGTGRLPLHSRLGPLIQSLAERGRGRDLLDVFARLASLEPGNPMVVANYGYWSTIHGLSDADFVVKQMQTMREHLPDAVPVRVVLGLGWITKGDVAKAVEATTIPGADWSKASPTYRAVRGTILMLAGKPGEAEPLLTNMAWDKMLPRETNYFYALLKPYTEGKSKVAWLGGLKPRLETDGGAAPAEAAAAGPASDKAQTPAPPP